MRRTILRSIAGAVLIVTACGPSAAPKGDPPVKLDVVKYEPLVQALQAQRGHIVVVDFWGDFCLPCKREFPNLVKLQQRHAKDGVVCMSISLDPVERRDAALAFLKAKGAVFPNYLLAEDAAVWQAKWDLASVPAVLVFYRDGTRAGKFDDDDPNHPFSYDDVEKLVDWLIRSDP
jgi:thiol-disulfide isomerase/thioredoxin